MKPGVSVASARALLLARAGVTAGRSYGLPAFLLAGKFFARFRDDETVLVLQLGSIDDRDVLMRMDDRAFFFTDHYRDYPAVLIRLADITRAALKDVIQVAWEDVSAQRARQRPKRRPGRKSR
jgi:hypothetical protein